MKEFFENIVEPMVRTTVEISLLRGRVIDLYKGLEFVVFGICLFFVIILHLGEVSGNTWTLSLIALGGSTIFCLGIYLQRLALENRAVNEIVKLLLLKKKMEDFKNSTEELK